MRAGFGRYGAVFSLLVFMTFGWVHSGTDRVHGGEPVRIALAVALTGIAAEDNRPAIRAAQLAVSEVNEAGGIHGVPLEMIVMDNGSTPLGSKRVAEEADKAGVLGVIGPLWSSHAMPMASVLQEAGVPMITPTATKPEITGVGDCIFRACMSDRFQGRVMARFAYEHLGARTAVTLTNVSEDYSITLADVFVKSFEEAGGEILWEGEYKGTAVDFQAVLERTQECRPEVLFIPGYARDSGLLVQQAVNMGIETLFLGGDGWGEQMRRYAGDALTGAYYSTHYHPDVPFAENRHLKEMYKTRFGENRITDMRIPLTYDSVRLFADALRRAVRLDRESVLKALASTRSFQGAAGTIAFDSQGDPRSKEAIILRFGPHQSAFIRSVTP